MDEHDTDTRDPAPPGREADTRNAAPRGRDAERRLKAVGPPWPVMPPEMGTGAFIGMRSVLWSRGSVSWYIGGGISLLWLISTGQEVIEQASTTGSAALSVALVVLYGVGFLLAVPVGWGLPIRWRLLPATGLFALSFTLFPWLGWDVWSQWTYVGVVVGMMVLSWRTTILIIVGLAALGLFFRVGIDGWTEDILWGPAIIFSISLMMAAFARTFAAMNQLRATQNQLSQLAAERERGRMARDIHDILGHSLTVITVKAELANKLIEVDPTRAKTEVAEIEQLARGALADVRTTVAGARGVNLPAELVVARAALEAAGITPEIPTATDAVGPAHRELAAWIVREGVTNVVRHSGATRCAVRLGPRTVEIADDGVGPVASSASSTGLAGLHERVAEAGGTLTIGRSDLGGFSLKVDL
ncbi:sensor histidine kinase [Microbacterium horticulturae]|uniref:Sensor histidine kinase n=1 Tax=Microbacterium horticulturae TaxID=3028316 RepID=A0ABY8BXP8_9MICO|nr:sensor histidine kinase [Microbacterium sp. KACC 23027]WEG08948.1 sensor histidine kinase [Microbacterium sp. KACC 23027]